MMEPSGFEPLTLCMQGRLNVCPYRPWRGLPLPSMLSCPQRLPEFHSATVDPSALADRISFRKAIPDGRYQRGVRDPQSRDSQWMPQLPRSEGVARKHCKALGFKFKRWPFETTFLYLCRSAAA
jgi:hypothetical protein